jgi:hypothetical protein
MSDYTLTPNLGLYKPVPDADIDLWGAHLNLNADVLDSALAGGATPFMVTATGTTHPRSVQDRFAEELCVLDFYPGTYSSGIDISDALIAALATGKNVYIPGGTYFLRKQITVGINGNTPQRLRGDGKSSYLIVDSGFDPAATSVIRLNGAETNAPTICDFRITFAQPTSATSRADFVVLGTPGAGTGLLGIKYPPAVRFGNGCNRFRIERVRFSTCWDGIWQDDGSTSGGWWLRDIEISPFNVGLKISRTKDFGHIHGWHHWPFETTGTSVNIMRDGQCYCMKLGQGGESEAINITDVTNLAGRILLDHAGSWCQFTNLMMDGDNATIEQVTQAFTQINNVYFTCSTAGPSGGQPSIKLGGGHMKITNIAGWCGLQPFVTITSGGVLMINGGAMQTTSVNVPLVSMINGEFRGSNLDIRPSNVAPWTMGVFQCTSTGIFMLSDSYVRAPSVGDVGLITIGTDSAFHLVSNIGFNGWKFTPPGNLGRYQSGSDFYSKNILTKGSVTAGSATTATAALRIHATAQKAVELYNNNVLRWTYGADNSDEFQIGRYNDAGSFQGNAFSIARATGLVDIPNLHAGAMSGPAITVTTLSITTGGPTIRAGTGAATGTQPAGSLWMRTDGSAGARLYVSAGAGTWTPVAGV